MAEGSETWPSTSSSYQPPPLDSSDKQPQVSEFRGLKLPNVNIPMFPIVYPVLGPGLFPSPQGQEESQQTHHGRGLYAVPVLPYMQPMPGFPSNTLVPFTYDIPTQRSLSETGTVNGEQGQGGEQPQQQQQAEPQRQDVRRFQIAIQLDLLLILKLAAVIFLFNQDGSRQRLAVLLFFATIIYLYQTGALAPVIRWLSQGMHRAAVPHQQPRPAARADNLPAAGGGGNENIGVAEGQPEGENVNQQGNDRNQAVENDRAGEPGQVEAGNRWWRIAKEVQMVVFGFITSLLPGFHNID